MESGTFHNTLLATDFDRVGVCVLQKVRGAFNDAMKCDTGRTPLIFLSVTVHLDQVDVNLEPNKTVVMLQNQVRATKDQCVQCGSVVLCQSCMWLVLMQEEIDNLIGEILGEVYSHSQKANLDGPVSLATGFLAFNFIMTFGGII